MVVGMVVVGGMPRAAAVMSAHVLCVVLCEKLIIREGKEWTIIYAIRCKGSKEARLPCEGMGIYTLSYWG